MRKTYHLFIFLGIIFAEIPIFTRYQASLLRVLDGDTIEILLLGKKEKLRLSYIDAPEMGQKSDHYFDDLGLYSKNCLKGILPQRISLSLKGRDRYQRLLGEVFIQKESVNLTMVKLGCADLYTHASFSFKSQYFDYLMSLEQAKYLRKGIWGHGGMASPKRYRQTKKRVSSRQKHR